MGRNFSQRPSQLLLIEDERLALDFDLACTTRLLFFDQEHEKRQLEAMTGMSLEKALGSVSKPNGKFQERSF